ncbi:MAG: hypothetical protein WAX69_22485 [Victivallales bacterium]
MNNRTFDCEYNRILFVVNAARHVLGVFISQFHVLSVCKIFRTFGIHESEVSDSLLLPQFYQNETDQHEDTQDYSYVGYATGIDRKMLLYTYLQQGKANSLNSKRPFQHPLFSLKVTQSVREVSVPSDTDTYTTTGYSL